MRARYLGTSIATALAFTAAVAPMPAIAHGNHGDHGGAKLAATLSGADEVDAQGARDKGDPDGAGSFAARLAPGQDKLCYTLSWSAIDAPTMAHIHSGAAGKNGPVFVGLSELGAGEQCIAVDQAKAAELIAKPADFYVNVHNPAFPAGAVRGQLVKQ